MAETAYSRALEWALFYEERGFSVVPVMRGEKRPSIAWEAYETKRASRRQLREWFTGLYRDCGPGVVTGHISGDTFVIDPDAGQGKVGLETLDDLQMTYDDLPMTWTGRTGGGGRHIFLRGPPGVRIRNGNNVLGLHVDVRGEGGFIVLPPTVHPNGQEYEWIAGLAPGELDIAMAPAWLIELVRDDRERPESMPGLGRSKTQGIYTPFGKRIDGRESYMRDLLWARLLEEYRESPIEPMGSALETILVETWGVFEQNCKTRSGSLASEGRGIDEMRRKLGYALRKWNTRIAREALRPKPGGGQRDSKEGGFGDPLPEPDPSRPLVLTAKQFIAGFTPPEYLVDGVIQRGYLYSLTAKTGHGKTVVSMYLAQCVARGMPMHGWETLQGSVLFLAGENPDDIRARFLVLADQHGFVAEGVPIHFIAGVVDLAAAMPRIHAEVSGVSDLRLVIVDTAAAYFRGDDANSNAQQGAYARLLRELTTLKGLPAVVVNSHPVKNAPKDNLLPVGGGAFVNEVDGNLTLWSYADQQTELHWQGKFRGPEFNPMSFRMDVVTCDSVKDAKGRLMPSVVAMPISDMEIEAGTQQTQANEDDLLRLIHASPGLSQRGMATRLGWVTDKGPNRARVRRSLDKLKAGRFLDEPRENRFVLTSRGKREIKVDDDD